MMRVIVHFCHTQSSLVRKIEKFSMTLEIAGPYVTHTQPTMQGLEFAFSQQHLDVTKSIQLGCENLQQRCASNGKLAFRPCRNAHISRFAAQELCTSVP